MKITLPKSSRLQSGTAIVVSALASLIPSLCQAGNPFITSIYTADPSARVFPDGRLYVFPSRDIDPPKGCDRMDQYHAFSTEDMVHWRDEGQILQASDVKWGRAEGGFMWAPDAIYKDGTYYFYFPHPSGHDWNNTWRVGVATSKKPASDYVPAPQPIQGMEGHAMIDPNVFLDTDGQAYIYFGGGGKCAGTRLKSNMMELDSPMQPMQGLQDFHEATWVFKRNNVYYLTYADNTPKHNQLRYATSDHPLGPWTHKGVFLEAVGSDTNHGSVVEYKGQWYAFYHSQTVSGQGNLRSICVDRLNFNDDGTIQMVVQTKEGVPAVQEASPPAPSTSYGVQTATLGGGAVLTNTGGRNFVELASPANTCEFNGLNGGQGGRAMLTITYAGGQRKGKIHLTINGTDCSFLNTPPTAGPDDFSGTATFTWPLNAGKSNVIRLAGSTGTTKVASVAVTPIDDPAQK